MNIGKESLFNYGKILKKRYSDYLGNFVENKNNNLKHFFI